MNARLFATLACALLPQACANANPAASGPSHAEHSSMPTSPVPSRPPAPEVPPIEHDGVRYLQDRSDERDGDQAGGYLAAVDVATGQQRWRLKVYDVPDHRAIGLHGGGLYFRSMQLSADRSALQIENESGAVFRVDLGDHSVTQLSGPPPTAPEVPAKPKPTPKVKP